MHFVLIISSEEKLFFLGVGDISTILRVWGEKNQQKTINAHFYALKKGKEGGKQVGGKQGRGTGHSTEVLVYEYWIATPGDYTGKYSLYWNTYNQRTMAPPTF